MIRRVWSHVWFVLLGATAVATAAEQHDIRVQWGVRIPMRDGVELAAVVYRPADVEEPVPAVVVITPYMADNYHGWGTWFAKRGRAYVTVDVRGRGNSSGVFEPFAHDAHDGYDTIEWLAQQPWCNGKIGMWGISYMGSNQWATAKECPPHLATIIPAAAAHPAIDFPMFNNIFYPYDMQWLTLTSGVTQNSNFAHDDDAYWTAIFTKLYMQHRPFRSLDEIAGNPSPVFQKWLTHPTPDAYWDAMVPSAEEYAQLDIPILTITGHYDADQQGALEFYKRHMRHGSQQSRAKHYLVIGPWDHSGCVHPKQSVRGIDFGPAAVVDLNSLYHAWYAWANGNGALPDFLKQRVACYLPGPDAEDWVYADRLDELTGETQMLYLHSQNGRANDVFHSGTLNATRPVSEVPDVYRYDPLDTTPGQREQQSNDLGKLDQTKAMTLGDRGVVYHTAPFREDTDVAGFVQLDLYVEMDVPDTDFSVELYEITSAGQSIPLASDALRARYRESLRRATFAEPGVVHRYVFDSFNFFARRVAQGSRLRLLITCPNSIHWQKNYNSGGVVADETADDARPATIHVHHSAEYPSVLRLPRLSSSVRVQDTPDENVTTE